MIQISLICCEDGFDAKMLKSDDGVYNFINYEGQIGEFEGVKYCPYCGRKITTKTYEHYVEPEKYATEVENWEAAKARNGIVEGITPKAIIYLRNGEVLSVKNYRDIQEEDDIMYFYNKERLSELAIHKNVFSHMVVEYAVDAK